MYGEEKERRRGARRADWQQSLVSEQTDGDVQRNSHELNVFQIRLATVMYSRQVYISMPGIEQT